MSIHGDKYDAARVTAGEASKVFRIAQLAYRARTIGDTEFLAARAVFTKAMTDFDAAESAYIETANATGDI